MTSPAHRIPLRIGIPLPGRTEGVILTSVVALLLFYYLARADVIGTLSAGRGWTLTADGALPVRLHFVAAALLLGVLPAAAARLLTGKRWRDLGLGIGNRSRIARWLAVGVPLALVAGRIASGSASMRGIYPLDAGLSRNLGEFVPYALFQFLYYAAWEVLFRGVLLFGLKDRLGASGANVLQTALSTIAHFGRPFTETFAAIPGGLVFGIVGLRTGSIWTIVIVHWLLGTATDWFILAR